MMSKTLFVTASGLVGVRRHILAWHPVGSGQAAVVYRHNYPAAGPEASGRWLARADPLMHGGVPVVVSNQPRIKHFIDEAFLDYTYVAICKRILIYSSVMKLTRSHASGSCGTAR